MTESVKSLSPYDWLFYLKIKDVKALSTTGDFRYYINFLIKLMG